MMADESTDSPGVIARPPRMYLGALGAGLIMDRLWPAAIASQLFRGAAHYVLGIVLVAAGIAILSKAMRQFRDAGTNVPTPLPAVALVTGGLYAHSRNPIYVALTLIYLGIAIAAASGWMLILLVPVLIVMRLGVIAREERYLERKFGADYLAYKARVRRWF